MQNCLTPPADKSRGPVFADRIGKGHIVAGFDQEVAGTANDIVPEVGIEVGEDVGDLDEALKNFSSVAALGSKGPHYHFAAGGMAHAEMVRGNYEAAHQWALQSHANSAAFNPALWMLIAVNAHFGRPDMARRYLADLKRIAPGVSLASIANGQVHQHPERFMPILAGMKQTGLT